MNQIMNKATLKVCVQWVARILWVMIFVVSMFALFLVLSGYIP
jgi:hypothetical protein